jgi:signal transduction histidine kinase
MGLGRLTSTVFLIAVGLALPTCADAESPTRGILIIDEFNQDSHFVQQFRQTIHSTLDAETTALYTLYSESLDISRFSQVGASTFSAYFGAKYKDIPISVIVTLGPKALSFVSRIRPDVWPSTPIVFAAAGTASEIASISPANAAGTISVRRFQDMVDSARLIVPQLAQVVLVGGPLDHQPFRTHYLEEAQQVDKTLKIIDLTGLPFADVLKRVGALPSDAAILYTPLYVDGSGLVHNPIEATKRLVGAANRPIIVDSETPIGTGVTGGRVPSPAQLGRVTAVKVARILNGEMVSNIPITMEDANKPVFDARQLERWGVDLTTLPADSDIWFRQLSAWDLYRWQIVAAFVVFAIQGFALLWFFNERRRRQAAEQDSHQHLLEVTKLDRAMTASAMSTSIAHELTQPLAAILNNAEAAEMLLDASSLDREQLKEILGDIHRDDQRAVAIIKHLRIMLKQNELQAQNVDLAETVRDALEIIEPRARERSVAIQIDAASTHFCVRADPIHLQQVILNLGMNAIDAMQKVFPDGRILTLRIRQQGDDVVVSMEDTGVGIPQDKLNAIFKAFVTTKAQGTGLGLSIARTIIETYGGRIWAENREQGGAAFHFALKLIHTGAPISA